jgi:sporulation protein YunB
MRRKIKLRKKVNLSKIIKSRIIILIILLFALSFFLLFKFINKKASPILINYAEEEIKKLSNIVVNKAISEQLVENAEIDDLFIVSKGTGNEIKTIDFNSVKVNKFLSSTTNTVQLYLKQIEEGNIDLLELPDDFVVNYDKKKLKEGIIYELPMGVVFGNSFLANVGPKIPIKYRLLGNINSNIVTSVTNYGINNALIEVSLNIRITQLALMPFVSKKIETKNKVPIAIKMIEGNIPNYYFNGISRESASIALPAN